MPDPLALGGATPLADECPLGHWWKQGHVLAEPQVTWISKERNRVTVF